MLTQNSLQNLKKSMTTIMATRRIEKRPALEPPTIHLPFNGSSE
jgi:hypothetical protein